jgi:hypothetical protein
MLKTSKFILPYEPGYYGTLGGRKAPQGDPRVVAAA